MPERQSPTTSTALSKPPLDLTAYALTLQPLQLQQNLLKPQLINLFQANKDHLQQKEDFLQPYATSLGLTLHELQPGFITASIPVDERTTRNCKVINILHGGASITFASVLGHLGSQLLLPSSTEISLMSADANHLRMLTAGQTLYGQAILMHFGATLHLWDVRLLDKQQNLVSLVRLTYQIKVC